MKNENNNQIKDVGYNVNAHKPASKQQGKEYSAVLYEQTGVATTCRSYEEYSKMFMLDGELPEHGAAILDVAAGASSFTAELNGRGYEAIACDPRYELHPDAMLTFALQEHEQASQKLASKQHAFDWKDYGSLHTHDEIRHHSLQQFIAHYRQQYSEATNDRALNNLSLNNTALIEHDNSRLSCYVAASLPKLPFSDHYFELVLCNHFLFLYQEQFDYSFHLQAFKELLRITKPGGRIIVYPLVGFRNELYPYLTQLQQELAAASTEVTLRETSFRFLPAAKSFLQITK